jgi:outer membrane protein assembly factor BamB
VNLKCILSGMVLVGASALTVLATDWPQYRGLGSEQKSADKIEQKWPASGPKELWRIPVGEAFGQVAVSGDKVFYFAGKDEREIAYAVDASTGKEIWHRDIDQTILHDSGGGITGPRTTPTVDGQHVYVYGTFLKLFCLDAADGKVLWTHDMNSEFQGQSKTDGVKQWGNAMSPIIQGDLVIVAGGGPGSSFMAFNKNTGAVVWKSGNEKITHASPTPATILGVPQVIFFMQSGMVSVDPKDGSELWRTPFKFSTSTAASPVVEGDIVYCSAGYGVGGGAVRLAKSADGKFSVTKLWFTPGKTINHWSTPLVKDGYLYGLFGFKEFKTEPLKCVEIATGKEVWSQKGFGQGGLILVGNDLLIQGDQGQLVLAQASPAGYKEIARAQPLAGKCWTMPVLANGRVYTRSTKELVCLDLGGK